MINFILLEDNINHKKKTEKIIINYMMKNKYEFDILSFSDVTEEFWNVVNSRDINYIYILDFELPTVTAIDVARKIRNRDWVSPIIILTVNGGMAFETFKQRLQILDFVSKQYEAEKNMHELFDICFKQLKIRKNFKYKIGKIDYNIDFDKILYIYKDTVERKCIVVTENNNYKVPITLIKIKELLDENFVYTHKACIVNTSRVDAYVWNENKIIFDNGRECEFLSKTHKKELGLGE